MSIYHTRKMPARQAAPPPAQPTARTGFAASEVVESSNPRAPSLARLRKATPVEYLLPASRAWLEGLPAAIRPVLLATKYARIVNLLAQQWADYKACDAYFDELLVDHRGKRAGFPADLRREIQTLRRHFQQVHYQRLRQAAGGDLAIV